MVLLHLTRWKMVVQKPASILIVKLLVSSLFYTQGNIWNQVKLHKGIIMWIRELKKSHATSLEHPNQQADQWENQGNGNTAEWLPWQLWADWNKTE